MTGYCCPPMTCFSPICSAWGPSACWCHSPTLSTWKNQCFSFIWTCRQSKVKSDRKGVQDQRVPHFYLPCGGPWLLVINAMAGQFFGNDLAAAPWPLVMQPLFGRESRLWEHKRSKAFKRLRFSQWTPDSWGRIGPSPIRSRCSLPFIATSNASTCSGVLNEPCGSEKKGTEALQ